MKTTVVIPLYQGLKFLPVNLPAVLQLPADEIIITDDCSHDSGVEYVQKNYPQIKVIRHDINHGFPQNVNSGIAAAKGEIIILLNQDVMPAPDLITRVLPYFKSPLTFAVSFNENHRSWSQARFEKGFIEYGNGVLDNKVHSSFWASGGSAAFRKSAWDQLGGFDTNYSPGYFEDADISYRAHKRGLEVIWAPDAIVSHAQPESTFKSIYSTRKLRYLKERNYLLLHWKNLDNPNLKIHFQYLIHRLLVHPGFILPFLMAATKLANVSGFRQREKSHLKLSDQQVFSKFV